MELRALIGLIYFRGLQGANLYEVSVRVLSDMFRESSFVDLDLICYLEYFKVPVHLCLQGMVCLHLKGTATAMSPTRYRYNY